MYVYNIYIYVTYINSNAFSFNKHQKLMQDWSLTRIPFHIYSFDDSYTFIRTCVGDATTHNKGSILKMCNDKGT